MFILSVQFNICAIDPAAVDSLQHDLHLPRFIAATLVARGIHTTDEARVFLEPSLERDWHNPYEIPGISEVADALEEAILARRHIVVFGDFDLDGISSTTVLTRGIRALGGRVTPFIPRRFEEGYGLTEAAYERVKELDPDLIVTVDCGIACRDEVAAIVADGMDIVVTDHHEASDNVPVGVPVADPKLDDDCESSILAGVGVALKLVQILGARRGFPHLWRSYTDLATLGTVADLMPMIGENRALVTDGLACMNTEPRPCVAALMGTSQAEGKPLTTTNLSFTLVPRLNAAGRMGDAQLALDLLMCDNFDEACQLAERLEAINDRRRSIEAELSEIAQEKAQVIFHGQRVLVVAGAGWHEGVKGIVASRLVGIYGVPTILFTIDGDEARGSGRSVGSVNLFAAVESTADLLTRFGGHEAAVGITLPVANLKAFEARLCAYMDALPEADFHPMVDIDVCVDLDELTLESVEMLDMLSPFGQENPEPTFLSRHVTLTNCRAVGADRNHLSCMLSNGRSEIGGILFHCNEIEMLLCNDSVVNAAFSLQIDEWRGRKSVKAMLKTLAPVHSCGALEACLDPQVLDFFTNLFSESNKELGVDEMIVTPQKIRGAHDSAQSDSRADEAQNRDSDSDARCDGSDSDGQKDRAACRAHWEELAQDDEDALESAIVRAIIGQAQLHSSQRAILDRLREGKSLLAVMATGRGKSLTFQVHAAIRALKNHEVSLFVYPLRALIADQAFHLIRALERFGIECAVLTGESTPEQRKEIYGRLKQGAIDIVLTTPEFLFCHVDKIAATAQVGFVVVDEAHHIGLAKAGKRSAYTRLGGTLAQLGCPAVLAVTATAPQDITQDISSTLLLDDHVIDETSRENLSVDDQRNIKNRDDYLAHLIAFGEKTVIYVNSREQSVTLARNLRRKVPHMAPLIGFYNAGLSRGERNRIENLFRNDDLMVLVATSAFGEGVDIPNIRHVVLYHMPFNEVEFNQMSGRAGRDGKPSTIHLLYGRTDIALNERILKEVTPNHDVMAQVYRCLRAHQQQMPGDSFCMDYGDLAQQASDRFHALSPTSAACGIAVFRELGLIETSTFYDNGCSRYRIRVNENAPKVDLSDSVRYREGLDEQEVFKSFCDWAMHCDSDIIGIRITHPITPNPDATSGQ